MNTTLIKILGLPDQFGVTLLSVALVFTLAPYFSNTDLGFIRIPPFSEDAQRRLRFTGPIFLAVAVVMHLPIPTTPTDPWWQNKQWRVDANDRRFGWEETISDKYDHLPATMDRQGVLVLHPLPDRPAVLTYVGGRLNEDATRLAVTVSGATAGDSVLRLFSKGVPIGNPSTVDGSRWQEVNFDISRVPRENSQLELHVEGGGVVGKDQGHDPHWWFETAFIDYIAFR
jgi:hypothetical protein